MVAGIKREAAHRWKVLGVGVAANASFRAAAQGIPTTAVWLRSDYHLSTAELGLAFGSSHSRAIAWSSSANSRLTELTAVGRFNVM
jgi:hypothetical protein